MVKIEPIPIRHDSCRIQSIRRDFSLKTVTHVESHLIRLGALVYFIVIGTFDDTSNPSNQPCH